MSSIRVPARGEGSLVYLRIVALHISGLSHGEIGEKLDLSIDTVKNALTSAEGQALITEAKRRMKENVFGRLEGEIVDLAEQSVKNLRETVEAKFVPGSRGKIHQDQMGLKLLGILGYSEGAMGEKATASMSVNNELGERLLKSLEKAEAAARLHAPRDITDLAVVSEDSDVQ